MASITEKYEALRARDRIRIRAEWRDWNGQFAYLLEEFIPDRKVLLFFPRRGYWRMKTIATFDAELVHRWADHYGLPFVTADS